MKTRRISHRIKTYTRRHEQYINTDPDPDPDPDPDLDPDPDQNIINNPIPHTGYRESWYTTDSAPQTI